MDIQGLIASIWPIIVIAFLVQQLWQVGKKLWVGGKPQANRIGPLVLGVILAATSGIDLFVALGVPLRWVWLAIALTGVLCSQGAGAIYDMIKKLQQYRAAPTTPVPPDVPTPPQTE